MQRRARHSIRLTCTETRVAPASSAARIAASTAGTTTGVVAFAGAAERTELDGEAVRGGGVDRGEHVRSRRAGHERLDREFDAQAHDTSP